MDEKTFLGNFATIADAPGGAQRLRAMVLGLALQGRLVDPDPEDEPVDSLLQSIDDERAEAIRANGWRAGRSPGEIRDDEVPWPIPRHWAWVRLERLVLPQAGFAFKSSHFNQAGRGMPLIRIRDIGNGTTECHFEGDFRDEFLVQQGDYLVGMDGNFNIHQWQGPPALLNQRVTRLMFFGERVERPFVTWALQDRINALHGSRAYTTVQHLSGKQIAAAVIPMPPLPEQERIVAKVEELMGLCDELEAHQELRCRATTRFRNSALHALTEAGTPDVFGDAWERVSAAWEPLTNHADAGQPWRQAIRDLAVAGWLSGIRGGAESEGDEFFGTLQDRRETHDWSGAVPPGWKSIVLGDLLVDGLMNGASPKPAAGQAGVTSLKLSATTRGVFDPTQSKAVDLSPVDAERYWLQPGDLLVQRSNTPQFVGMAALYDGPERRFIFPDLMMRGRIVEAVEGRFVHLSLLSSPARAFIRSRASGTSQSMVKVTQKAVMEIPVALPPRAEQQRVVAAVEALETRVSRLVRGLLTRSDVARALAASATHQQFA